MEGTTPPDWQDGDYCYRCRTNFTLVSRKHHCRNCGNIFCARCSSKQMPIPKLNIDKSVRVCDGCYEKLSDPNQTEVLTSPASSYKASHSDSSDKNRSGSRSTTTSSSSSKSNSMQAANASAPSEQELREEEELQLALALSLSEAPKFTFPEIKQFENTEPVTQKPSSLKKVNIETVVNPVQFPGPTTTTAATNSTNQISPDKVVSAQAIATSQLQGNNVLNTTTTTTSTTLGTETGLRRFVEDVKSTAEIFTNRINSSKLRNRPISSDSAIQSLFMKLTDMHAKLLEQIKIHEEERACYEALQDKLSQIADARAALDALRDEHQEKVRREAEEAERLRQSQLASKLEMMRQKKTQMMQYQRELALQRIQAQEMMMNQTQVAQTSITSNPMPNISPSTFATADSQQQHHPSTIVQQPPVSVPQPTHSVAIQDPSQNIPTQIVTHPPMFQPSSYQDEAPLISFDD